MQQVWLAIARQVADVTEDGLALWRLNHGFQAVTSNRKASDLFACKWLRAPATMDDEEASGRRRR